MRSANKHVYGKHGGNDGCKFCFTVRQYDHSARNLKGSLMQSFHFDWYKKMFMLCRVWWKLCEIKPRRNLSCRGFSLSLEWASCVSLPATEKGNMRVICSLEAENCSAVRQASDLPTNVSVLMRESREEWRKVKPSWSPGLFFPFESVSQNHFTSQNFKSTHTQPHRKRT